MLRYLSSAPIILGLAVAAPMIVITATPASAQLAIGVSVRIAPPALPVYVQPPLPAPGYIWTPGYWAYGDDGYYWVPGTWVEPPQPDVYWTPAWWGWNDGVYAFHPGYWGPHVGFYGGIDYGFGYNGFGFFGGHWDHGGFAYNENVNNFGGTHVTNVYRENVTNNTVNRVSFNGGQGGINARPTADQEAAEHEQHIQPTAAQAQHFDAAKGNPALHYAKNHGNPAIAATPRPGAFNEPGVSHAGPAAHEAQGAPRQAAAHAAPHAAPAHAAPHPAAARAAPRAAPHPAPARPAPARAAPARAAPHPAAARPAPHPAPAAHKEEEHR
jgi:hypothetical protein